MSKRARQYIGILAAMVAYYIIHEGAHLVVTLILGVFKEIRFMGLGMQIDVEQALMTDRQLAVFCFAGAAATLIAGWALLLGRRKLCAVRSAPLRAAAWYTTIAMLLLDPVYLSVLCSLFGGGDMNGMKLLAPELTLRLGFGALGVVNAVALFKLALPVYRESFAAAAK